MTRHRIFADFQNADTQGRVRLNCVGTTEDLQRLGIKLRRDMEIILYSDELEAAGAVDYNDEEHLWVAVIDWDAVKESAPESRANGSRAASSGQAGVKLD